jgi:hypothetical protein
MLGVRRSSVTEVAVVDEGTILRMLETSGRGAGLPASFYF